GLNQGCIKANRSNEVSCQDVVALKVYQHFERSQGHALGRVNDRSTLAIPSAAEKASSFPCKGRGRVLRLENAPGGDVQTKTPCSRRPIKSSTARAPISVSAAVRGVSLPSALLGLSSQFRAAVTSPSNNPTAFSKTTARRRSRSDSSPVSFPCT